MTLPLRCVHAALARAFAAAMEPPGVRALPAASGLTPVGGGRPGFSQGIGSEIAQWSGTVAKDIGATID